MVEPSLFILEKYGLVVFLIFFIIAGFTYLLRTIVTQWTAQSTNFTEVIRNHLTHNTEFMNKTVESLTALNNEMKDNFIDIRKAHDKQRDEHDEILEKLK